jgi:hypothetical protein
LLAKIARGAGLFPARIPQAVVGWRQQSGAEVQYAGGMPTHTTIASALAEIEAFDGAPQDLALSIDESLLDPAGVSMAIVTDAILAKGWMPDGVEPHDGHRVYRYRLA